MVQLKEGICMDIQSAHSSTITAWAFTEEIGSNCASRATHISLTTARTAAQAAEPTALRDPTTLSLFTLRRYFPGRREQMDQYLQCLLTEAQSALTFRHAMAVRALLERRAKDRIAKSLGFQTSATGQRIARAIRAQCHLLVAQR